jgi:hypothetical protein
MPERVDSAGQFVLILSEAGKDAILSDEATLGKHVNQGDILILADLRGFGETADPVSLNDAKYWNHEYRNAMLSLHTGTTIVGQRVKDIMTLVDFISSDARFSHLTIKLQADGVYGPAAIHAAYLDKRIHQTEISRSVRSYLEFIKNPLQLDMYSNVIPGVLKYYDLIDLTKKKAGRRSIVFMD